MIEIAKEKELQKIALQLELELKHFQNTGRGELFAMAQMTAFKDEVYRIYARDGKEEIQ
jgi:hypothetical protein